MYFFFMVVGIIKISIIIVDEDIIRLEERGDFFNDGIGVVFCFNYYDDVMWVFEVGYEIG